MLLERSDRVTEALAQELEALAAQVRTRGVHNGARITRRRSQVRIKHDMFKTRPGPEAEITIGLSWADVELCGSGKLDLGGWDEPDKHTQWLNELVLESLEKPHWRDIKPKP